MNNSYPFGGKTILFAGDFRQILPVVRHGTPGHIVDASFSRSVLWRSIKILYLTINMRLRGNNQYQLYHYGKLLLRIGEGKEKVVEGEDIIDLPQTMCVVPPTVDALIEKIFDQSFLNNERDPKKIISRAILTPFIKDTLEMNDRILDLFPGEEMTYLSSDSVKDPECRDFTDFIPVEYLNKLAFSGFPPHCLKLKKNAPVICLRNLKPEIGLCNGTRLVCKQFRQRVIVAEIANGSFVGTTVFLHRVNLITQESGLPFQVRRRQFPIALAFSMTINKSQSQSLDKVGIYLPMPVFSHGQLYVALSRATSPENVWVMTDTGNKTRNVVFPQALTTKPNQNFFDLPPQRRTDLMIGKVIYVFWNDEDGKRWERGLILKKIDCEIWVIRYDFLLTEEDPDVEEELSQPNFLPDDCPEPNRYREQMWQFSPRYISKTKTSLNPSTPLLDDPKEPEFPKTSSTPLLGDPEDFEPNVTTQQIEPQNLFSYGQDDGGQHHLSEDQEFTQEANDRAQETLLRIARVYESFYDPVPLDEIPSTQNAPDVDMDGVD